MTGNILNLPAYRVERVEETEHDYHIYAETVKPRMVCSCGSANVATWGAHEQVVKDLPMHGKRVGIYVRTRRFRDHVTDLEAQVRFETPQWLGLDEIHIIRKPRCVVSNIEARAIVNILRDRNKRTITAYLHALEGRDRVKFVAMDMWSPYREAVAAVMPQRFSSPRAFTNGCTLDQSSSGCARPGSR
jgi:transposase